MANGDRIANLGENIFTGVTEEEGHLRTVRAQICEVSKPLMSVSKLVKAGNSVVFAPDGAYVHNAETDEYIALVERNGMYHIRLWVHNKDAAQETGF